MIKKIIAVGCIIAFVLVQTYRIGYADKWANVKKQNPYLFSKHDDWQGEWSNGWDFAHFRDNELWWRKSISIGSWAVLGAVIGAALGGVAGMAVGARAGAALSPGMTYFVDTLTNLVSTGAEYGVDWSFPQPLEQLVRNMDKQLGISDYYVFANRTIDIDIGPDKDIAYPIGADLEIKFSQNSNDNPLLYRLRDGVLDFERIGSQIQENDISGRIKNISIERLYTYEYFNGQVLRKGSRNLMYNIVDVHPASNTRAIGRIVGKAELKYLPRYGISGLREIHLASPINEGFLFKGHDVFAYVIVLNQETVSVEGPPGSEKPKVGEELKIKVKVKGLHPAKEWIEAKNKSGQYPWSLIANKVFKGAVCDGAGIRNTEIIHHPNHTEFRCTPTKTGAVSVILQTYESPVHFPVTTVEEKTEEDKRKKSKIYKSYQYVIPETQITQNCASFPEYCKTLPMYFGYNDKDNTVSVQGGIDFRGSYKVGDYYLPSKSIEIHKSSQSTKVTNGKFRCEKASKDNHAVVVFEGQLAPDFKSASGYITIKYLYSDYLNKALPPGIQLKWKWKATCTRVVEWAGFIE